MKKYIISTSLLALAIATTSAEEATSGATAQSNSKPPLPVRAMMQAKAENGQGMQNGQGVPMQIAQMLEQNITTGDAQVDLKVRALQKEMQAKIETIRTEYQTKIKATIGDRKVSISKGMNASSTYTQPKMPKMPMDRKENASGTMMMKPGLPKGDRGTVKGVSVDQSATEEAEARVPGGLFGFMRGFFGN